MNWKKENGLHVGYQNQAAVVVISTEYAQPCGSRGKYFKVQYKDSTSDYRKLTDAKQAAERRLEK